MQIAIIKRIEFTDKYTLGILEMPSFTCYTMERPWLDNASNVSCVPSGEYDCSIRVSPKFGRVYQLKDVPGRQFILIHAGNTANNTHGCVLLGKSAGYIEDRRAVLCSRPTLRRFMSLLDEQDFKLVIKGDQHVA
jgi:hypothetical protein